MWCFVSQYQHVNSARLLSYKLESWLMGCQISVTHTPSNMFAGNGFSRVLAVSTTTPADGDVQAIVQLSVASFVCFGFWWIFFVFVLYFFLGGGGLWVRRFKQSEPHCLASSVVAANTLPIYRRTSLCNAMQHKHAFVH